MMAVDYGMKHRTLDSWMARGSDIGVLTFIIETILKDIGEGELGKFKEGLE